MLRYDMPTVTLTGLTITTSMQLLSAKAYTNPLYGIYCPPTHMQLARLSRGQFEAPTWKERCALDEAQRALFREGPSRAAELRKSCAAQTQKKKNMEKKKGRKREEKNNNYWVNEDERGKTASFLAPTHSKSTRFIFLVEEEITMSKVIDCSRKTELNIFSSLSWEERTQNAQHTIELLRNIWSQKG